MKKFSCVFGIALCAGLLLAGCGKTLNKALKKAQGKAKRTECVNNLKQMSACVIQYLNDNRACMPSIENLERGKYIQKGAASDPKSFVCCPETHQQYEVLIPPQTRVNNPQFQNGKSPSQIQMIHCPKHGHVVYLDGVVEEQK